MKIKRLISVIIAVSMLIAVVPVSAEPALEQDRAALAAERLKDIEDKTAGYTGKDPESTQEPFSNEPQEHTETVSDDFELPEIKSKTEADGGIALASADDTNKAMWQSFLADRFGDSYLTPFRISQGQTVSGSTNRLVINETDLTLPGKNGLDVNIRRKHDNQFYEDVSLGIRENGTAQNKRYIYAFNRSDGGILYIGFSTRDDFYTFGENGMTIRELPKSYDTMKRNNTTIAVYRAEDIYSRLSDTGITLEYNSSIPEDRNVFRYDSSYALTSTQIYNEHNLLGSNWLLDMPSSYVTTGFSEMIISETSQSKKTRFDFRGLFRDLNGGTYSYDGWGTFIKYNDGTENTYSSTFSSGQNSFLSFTQYLKPQTLDGIQYNFVIEDSGSGLTYYFYNKGVSETGVSGKQNMFIEAVRDRCGNTIKYNYDDSSYGAVTGIIDTYGRTITIDHQDGKTEVSYTDETNTVRTIKYETETLPASSLNNDSPIKSKEVNRLKVTNAEGETTVYDSRSTATIDFFYSSRVLLNSGIYDVRGEPYEEFINSNIERIIYPNGDESRYRYKRIYTANSSSKTAHGIYAVDESYDIIGGEKKNNKQYTLELGASGVQRINKTVNDVSKGSVCIQKYDTLGMLEEETVSADGTTWSKPYRVTKYTYNSYIDNPQPTSIETNESGVAVKTAFSYNAAYPELLMSKTVEDKKTEYTYHTIDGKLTRIPSAVNYKYKSGTEFKTDYSVVTTLNDKGLIEYERNIVGTRTAQQTKYDYDEYGRTVSVTQWVDDTNNDDVLDENDETAVRNLSYEDNATNTVVTESVSGLVDADGSPAETVSEKYYYNPRGNVYKMIDSKGSATTVNYDGAGRAIKYNYVNGANEIIDYNAQKGCTNVKDIKGVTTWTYYNSYGSPTSRYFYNNGWIQFEGNAYDSSGRPVEAWHSYDSGKSVKEKYTYDIFDRIVSKSVYDNNTLMYTEAYTYSSNGSTSSVTKKVTAADGTVTADETDTYDKLGRVITKEQSNGSDKVTHSYEYDYKGNVTSETDGNGNQTLYVYTYNNDIRFITHPNLVNEGFSYDMLNRRTAHFDMNWDVTRYYYDALGRVIINHLPMGTNSCIVKNYYDGNSNIIKKCVNNHTTAEGDADNSFSTTEYEYDNMNNLTGVISNDGTAQSAVRYSYDTGGRVTAMTTGLASVNDSGGATTRYSYGMRSYLVKETDAMGKSVTYVNDYDGNVKSITDRNGAVTTNVYGPHGITESTVTDGTATEKYRYTYNSLGMQTKTELYNDGVLQDSADVSYDAFGRVTSQTSNGRSNCYTYDNNSNIISYKLMNGSTVESDNSYTYDTADDVKEANINGTVISYKYDEAHNVIEKKIGDNVTSITYNEGDLPLTYVNKTGDTVNASYTYTYNVMGCRLSETDSVNNINKTYTYDDMGRLKKEVQSGAANRTASYTYDKRGNRITEAVTGDESYLVTNTYNANNCLTQSEYKDSPGIGGEYSKNINYIYDANGNQIIRNTQTYGIGELMSLSAGDITSGTVEHFEYNLKNQLVGYRDSDTSASYVYRADGLRKSKTVDGVTTGYVWNGGNLAEELNGSSIKRQYGYGPDGISTVKENNTTSLYIKNAHGDIIGKTDDTGEVYESYLYSAFGNILSETEPDPMGYCGEYRDSETGLIYLRNRYYDSSTGRFISEDPAKDGLNWYAYCSNNPINYVDPTGLGLKIEGNYQDRNAFMIALKILTDDHVAMDNDGNVTLTEGYEDSRYEVGTSLVKRIIDNDNTVVLSNGRHEFGMGTEYKKDDKLADTRIELSSEYKALAWDYASESVQLMDIPIYIVVGHELIHALRDFNGSDKGLILYGVYKYYDADGKEHMGQDLREELETSGIDYIELQKFDEYSATPEKLTKPVYANSWVTSENALRREHGIGDRISYGLLEYNGRIE